MLGRRTGGTRPDRRPGRRPDRRPGRRPGRTKFTLVETVTYSARHMNITITRNIHIFTFSSLDFHITVLQIHCSSTRPFKIQFVRL